MIISIPPTKDKTPSYILFTHAINSCSVSWAAPVYCSLTNVLSCCLVICLFHERFILFLRLLFKINIPRKRKVSTFFYLFSQSPFPFIMHICPKFYVGACSETMQCNKILPASQPTTKFESSKAIFEEIDFFPFYMQSDAMLVITGLTQTNTT